MGQEAQLMLTNLRNAFRDQSRSCNMVPFDMLDMVSCKCAIVTVIPKTLRDKVTVSQDAPFFRQSTSKNVTLKCGSEVIQGH